MLHTVILTAPAVQIVPGLIRYTWLIPKGSYVLIHSCTYYQILYKGTWGLFYPVALYMIW